jgi:hypothetical protein
MKLYVGVGHSYQRYPAPGYVEVWESEPSGQLRYVRQLGHRTQASSSPDAFRFGWGADSSRSAALAQALLEDVSGSEPDPQLSQDFQRDYVAAWPVHEGECWRVTQSDIEAWLNKREAG